MEIRNRIRELRKKKNMTQQELAKLVNMDYTHIGRIEKGERTLDVEKLEDFAKALGCEPYEILPKEWQPLQLSDEEKEILKLFRKKTDTQDTSLQTESTTIANKIGGRE